MPSSPNDVETIIRKAKQGDKTAIAILYETYADLIYRYISHRVPEGDVEDITSDVFVNMVQGLPEYEIVGAPFEAWLYRIASARIADYYRKRSRRLESDLSETMSDTSKPLPEESLIESQEVGDLKKALEQLNEEERMVVILRFVERKSHREVAHIMGKSEMAVRSIQHRALVRMTHLLGIDDKARHYLRGRHE